MTVERPRALARVDGAPELVRSGTPVEALRVVKDDAEIALLARGLRDRRPGAAPSCWPRSRAGPDRARGRADGSRPRCSSSAPTASRSRRSSRRAEQRGPAPPADRPGDRSRGDLLKIDFGARVGGYHADMTRTVVVGGEPADWQREIYDVVRRGAAGRPGSAGGRMPTSRRRRRGGPRRRGRRPGYGEHVHRTGSGTASAWRSTRRRCSGAGRPVDSPPARR